MAQQTARGFAAAWRVPSGTEQSFVSRMPGLGSWCSGPLTKVDCVARELGVYLHMHGGSFGGFEKEKLFKGPAALQEKSEKKKICPKVSTFSFEREKVMEES